MQAYAFLQNLSVRDLRRIARFHKIRQTHANKMALVARIILFIITRVQTAQQTVASIFSAVLDTSYDQYLINWTQIQHTASVLPSLHYLYNAANRLPLNNPVDDHLLQAYIVDHRSVQPPSSHSLPRPPKPSFLHHQPHHVSTTVAASSLTPSVDPLPPLTDSEFARLFFLLRYNPVIREHHQRRTHQRVVTDTTAHPNPATPSFWKTTVEPLFNCDPMHPPPIFPAYIQGPVDATAKPVVWRDGLWLQLQLLNFAESFAKLYREYRTSAMGAAPFQDYCEMQCLDFNASLVKRFLMCAFLIGVGTDAADEILLSMVSCDANVASDAVSEIGMSGEKRNVSSNSENDAPTSLNTAEYEDITRSMYNLLTVLKERVSLSIGEGSEQVNGADIVNVIEQKEALLFALSRAKQKANEATTADLKGLWMQQSEDIRKMLTVLSTKK